MTMALAASMLDHLAPGGWLDSGRGPLYLQLAQRIEAGIGAGLIAAGQPLPPEREIAARTGTSRVTVRKAVADLAARGLIRQRHGSGSYVAPVPVRVEQSLSRLTSFSEDMARRGLTSQAEWLGRGLFLPSPDEVLTLGLGPGDMVARLDRLRRAEGRPMAIERAALPPDILPDPMRVEASLYAALGARGCRPVRAVQRISAVNLGPGDAALLAVPAGVAGLKIVRISYLPGGRVAELTRSLYRSDAYDFVAELRIPEELS